LGFFPPVWVFAGPFLAVLLPVCDAAQPASTAGARASGGKVLHVADFGARPDDGKDDLAAIRDAIAAALRTHTEKIVLDPGTYELDQPEGENCLSIRGAHGLTVEGGTGAGGKPATRLVRRHTLNTSGRQFPAILSVRESDRFTLRNVIFDNSPQITSAGYVMEKQGDTITVDVLEGLPVVEGVGPYCANLWDPQTRTLRKVPSVTYGGDVDVHKLRWRKVPGGDGRRLSLKGDYVSSKVAVGDLMSWHFHYRGGAQVMFAGCRDLRLSNLHNVNGYPMVTHDCTNIHGDRIVFRPEGNQLAVGPRDGWFIWAGHGNILIEDMHCEGVRWDGQNVHGSFLKVRNLVDDRTLETFKQGDAYTAITPGSKVAFWQGPHAVERAVEQTVQKTVAGENIITLKLAEPIPDFVARDTVLSVYAWDIPLYTLRNCTFRNIAGCASIIRNRQAFFDRCTYEHVMYPAILLGASVSEGEGTFPQDVTIRDCIFRSSGWAARHNAKGCIAIRNVGGAGVPGDGLGPQKEFNNAGVGRFGEDGLYMGTVRIEGCRFEDSELGIDIHHVKEVLLAGNSFKNVDVPYRIGQNPSPRVIERKDGQ
jgi:hypothetical protein